MISGARRQTAECCTDVRNIAKITQMPKLKNRAHELNLLVNVAELYYQEGLHQAEIAKRLSVSRSTISRALQEARTSGIVEITIHSDRVKVQQLEFALQEAFALKEVRVLQAESGAEDTIDELGRLAAQYLSRQIRDGMILGVSYGRSVAATIRHLKPESPKDVMVIQLIGALGAKNPLIEGADLSRQLAIKYGGSYRYLYAPLLVEDKRTRDLLLEEPLVHDVLAIGKQANLALFGIGALEADFSNLWSDYLSPKALDTLRVKGAVGHLCAEFFDARGNVLDVTPNERSVSIGLRSLHEIQTVVAVAGGLQKSRAILGALRGGYIDVLITDEAAAGAIAESL